MRHPDQGSAEAAERVVTQSGPLPLPSGGRMARLRAARRCPRRPGRRRRASAGLPGPLPGQPL